MPKAKTKEVPGSRLQAGNTFFLLETWNPEL
jgi:hypothetical protein